MALCERLLQTDFMEEGLSVEDLMDPFLKDLTPQHFPVLDRWVDYFTDWAITDSVSVHVIGALLERYPELTFQLVSWTQSDNRWRRRASCVSLVLPLRRSKVGPEEVFCVTGHLMGDKDDMVQKGVGWVLKVLSVAHQAQLLQYLQRYPAAGRTLVRYALEKVPVENRRLFIPSPSRQFTRA